MRIVIWIVAAVVALCATASVAVLASLSQWLVTQSDLVTRGAQAVAQWPVPAWLSVWLDPAMLESLRAAMVWLMDMVIVGWPWLQPALSWIGPVLWLLWGVGMVTLLLLAGLAHWAWGRWQRPAAAK